jgi:hypothetical protein
LKGGIGMEQTFDRIDASVEFGIDPEEIVDVKDFWKNPYTGETLKKRKQGECLWAKRSERKQRLQREK